MHTKDGHQVGFKASSPLVCNGRKSPLASNLTTIFREYRSGDEEESQSV